MTEKTIINEPVIEDPSKAIYNTSANKIIRRYTVIASGSGIIPNFLISAASVTGIQVLLIMDLCKLYNIPFRKRKLYVIINSVLGSVATRVIALAAMSIPGISSPMKGLSGATVAGIYTATVGEFYKVHFQNGGTLEDASIRDLTKYIVEEYNRGDISISSIMSPFNILRKVFK